MFVCGQASTWQALDGQTAVWLLRSESEADWGCAMSAVYRCVEDELKCGQSIHYRPHLYVESVYLWWNYVFKCLSEAHEVGCDILFTGLVCANIHIVKSTTMIFNFIRSFQTEAYFLFYLINCNIAHFSFVCLVFYCLLDFRRRLRFPLLYLEPPAVKPTERLDACPVSSGLWQKPPPAEETTEMRKLSTRHAT